MNIEFTDRYGGTPPSWLQGCHGECEATGWYPEPCARTERDGGSGPGPVDPCQKPDDHLAADFDGWHFLRCGECKGTGRVVWYVSLARIPAWIAKAGRFFWTMSDRRYQPAHFTYAEHIWLVFKCAFVYDLMRLRRPA